MTEEEEKEKEPLRLRIVFQHPRRQHSVMLSKLIRTYIKSEKQMAPLVYSFINMLSMKGIVGANKGFISETGLVLVMIAWLQKSFKMGKAQLIR